MRIGLKFPVRPDGTQTIRYLRIEDGVTLDISSLLHEAAKCLAVGSQPKWEPGVFSFLEFEGATNSPDTREESPIPASDRTPGSLE